jgi:hypothetical protein
MNIGYTTTLSQHMGNLIRLVNGICGQFFTRSPKTFKTVDFLEKDWKLIGVDAREESGVITKEGLN